MGVLVRSLLLIYVHAFMGFKTLLASNPEQLLDNFYAYYKSLTNNNDQNWAKISV